MKNNTTRIIIETMVRKAIKDIKDSPKRSTRNLVDMAFHFAEGRFQRHFFSAAQTMLKNENSSYYALAQDIVTHVDADRIVTCGMNIGYNGCTVGAKKIREIEETEGYNVPWSVALLMDEKHYLEHLGIYHNTVTYGKELGIYVWQLCTKGDPSVLLPLLEMHPDCAFTLLCDPQMITDDFLNEIERLNHVIPIIRYEKGTAEVCRAMRDRSLLYGVCYTYTAADEEMILSGDLFYDVEPWHPIFTMFVADPQCPIHVQERIYDGITRLRDEQILQTIPWEITYDSSMVDSIISSEPCAVLFDYEGNLHTCYTREQATEYNLFQSDLVLILQQALPKQESIS